MDFMRNIDFETRAVFLNLFVQLQRTAVLFVNLFYTPCGGALVVSGLPVGNGFVSTPIALPIAYRVDGRIISVLCGSFLLHEHSTGV